MTNNEIISWLLEGDISIQYQVNRDLMNSDNPQLRARIESEGWGFRFLACRSANGHWGRSYYQPKWISSHYTLLDLKNLGISPGNKRINETLKLIFENEKGHDGGILPIGTVQVSDVCVNGMALNFASYFQVNEESLKSVIDFLLSQRMGDGGYNCHSNRKGAVHSSFHTTLSVLEGFHEYISNGYSYRKNEIELSQSEAEEFLLMHKLFRSDKTGKILNPNFLKFRNPPRWYYDIMKALDYFQYANRKYDIRMDDALALIQSKKTKDGLWNLSANHPGLTHFDMEFPGKPSRWNTLRALRILKKYAVDN